MVLSSAQTEAILPEIRKKMNGEKRHRLNQDRGVSKMDKNHLKNPFPTMTRT